MSINNKRSYTEYTITQPTTDFAIGFDDFDEGGKDNILVTLNGVLVESLGYAAIRKNESTVTITPAITEGTVRLTRETDIDEPFHKFTAGALFSAKSMDENFQQVRNSQQEVRDGFVFLEYNTNGIVQASKEATLQAKAATVEATASAVRAETAADTAVQAVDTLQGVVIAATTATTNANSATATATTAASQATAATTSAQNAAQAANTAKQEAAAAASAANAATVDTLAATGRANAAADVVADLVVGKVRAQDVSTADGSTQDVKNTEFRSELDTLPFEDGLLPTTKSTYLNNAVGAVNRVLHDKLQDVVSVKDFGAEGDGITNDTASIVKAAKSNKAVYFPAGTYLMDAADSEVYGYDINFYANGDATIDIKAVSGARAVFKLGANSSVNISGLSFDSNATSWQRVFLKDTATPLDSIIIDRCKFYNKAMICLLEGSPTLNPMISYTGITRFHITNSLFQDMYYNAVQLSNCPVRDFQFTENECNNFLSVMIYIGIGNSTPYAKEIKSATWRVVVSDNNFTNDDATYPRAGSYHCCLLVECDTVYWERNKVEGLKSLREDSVVYDAYLTATNIIHRDNVIKNICSFHPNATFRVLIKAKSSSIGLVRTKKIIEGNTYTIEKDWVARVGQGNKAEHYLYQLNDTGSGGDVVVKNNIFNLQGYIQAYDGYYDNLSFTDNEITAEYFVTTSPRYCFFNATSTAEAEFMGSMHIKRNKWKFKTLNNLAVSVYSHTTNSSGSWKYVDISDNTFECLEANKPTERANMFSTYKADETLFTNNTFINITFDTVMRTAEMGVFTAKNNNFSNDYYLLSGLSPFGLTSWIYWARFIKAPVNMDLNILANYSEKSMVFYLPNAASDWGLEDKTIAVGEYAFKMDTGYGLVASSTLIDFKFAVKNVSGVLTLSFLEYVPEVAEVPASTSTKNIVLTDGSFTEPVDVASSILPNTKIGIIGVGANGIYFEPIPILRTICNLDIKLKIDKFPSTHTGI